MSRQKPRNNGKPIKTEPGAIRSISQNDKIANSQLKKLNELE